MVTLDDKLLKSTGTLESGKTSQHLDGMNVVPGKHQCEFRFGYGINLQATIKLSSIDSYRWIKLAIAILTPTWSNEQRAELIQQLSTPHHD